MRRLWAMLAPWGARWCTAFTPTRGDDMAAWKAPRLRQPHAALCFLTGLCLCLPSAGGLCTPMDHGPLASCPKVTFTASPVGNSISYC